MAHEFAVKRCLLQIEERLAWGSSANWTNYDFEKLTVDIEEKTGVTLSVTTLKRIWGKVKYDHSPTLTTLNTLARFLDFEDWRSFEKRQSSEMAAAEAIQPEATDVKAAFPVRRLVFPIVLSVLPVILILVFVFSGKRDPPSGGNASFRFEADKVLTEGVPNSVIFTYDASAAAGDSVFIVQTWDIRRKTKVSKNNTRHSAVYYYPGFFRTKLIADDAVVKTHDLQISSKGWLCLVEREPVPIYFPTEECKKDDRIEVDHNILEKYNIAVRPALPKVRFFNQRDMGDLMNDNFRFETVIKNEFDSGVNSCQFVQVLIQCKDDIIIIPLSAKGCIGDISLYAAGKQLDSREADLSGFGADLSEWTTLRVECRSRAMQIFVNDRPAASFTFPNDPSGIVGLQYRFDGTGAVKDTWFEDENGKILMD